MNKLQRIHLMSQTVMLKPLRQFVRELASCHACSKKYTDDLVMAVNEACMNVIQHAYHNSDKEEIVIEFWQDADKWIIKIFDDADDVDITAIKSRDLDDIRPGGLGVHIIQQLMDSVEYKNNISTKGNVLEMRKTICKTF